MARRLLEYALIAAIVCLIPAVFWPEWVMPATLWGDDPSVVKIQPWQARLFTAIVAMPALIGDKLHLSESAYGCAAGVSWCREIYVPPPTVAAVEFLRVGLPFWFLSIGLLGEGAVWVRRRLQRAGPHNNELQRTRPAQAMEPRR
jgi:hypothetical protein